MKEAFQKALKDSLKVSWMLIQVYIPLSLLTIFLKQIGFIDFIAPFFAPMMRLIGLPGETAITLIAGFTNNIYAALGTMAAFDLTPRQVTILGIVIGISHNLIVETGVLIKLKMANFRIAFFRIAVGLITGVLINLILPQNIKGVRLSPYYKANDFSWLKSFQKIGITCLQIVVIIFLIMLMYELVMLWKHKGVIKQKFKPISKIIGFSDSAFVPWIIAFIVGIAYSAGILFQLTKNQKLNHRDVCLITTFLCVAHAAVEDTMLFGLLGGNLIWIIATKAIVAFTITRIFATRDIYKKFLWIGLRKE
ncbi:MAG: nucleoside recognition domain-containing protein [bacterium]